MSKSGKTVKPRTIENGTCTECGAPVVIAVNSLVPLEMYTDEEFCSATCARAHHGVTDDSSLPTGRKKGMVS